MMTTINIESLQKNLCSSFCRDVAVRAIDDEILAVSLPLVGRDGDHLMAYVTQATYGWRVSDMGTTMMRLSYENDLTTLLSGSREKLYSMILTEAGLTEDDGEIYLEAPADGLPMALFALGQGLTRIEDLGLWTKGRVENTFYDDLRSLIAEIVPAGEWKESYIVPEIDDGPNYPVDYMVKTPGRPLYVFGVLNQDKARLATIILQYLAKQNAAFDSMVVCSDIDNISRVDVKRLMNAANDVVASIDDRDVIRQKIEHRLRTA